MAVYQRHATRAQKHVVDTIPAHARAVIGGPFTKVKVLAVGDATYDLIFVFSDGTRLVLSNTELTIGDVFSWDILELLITNTAQALTTGPTLLCDQQYLEK